MSNYHRFFKLGNPPGKREHQVVLYADQDGALRTVDEDGTNAAVGSPNGGSNPWKTYVVSYTDFVLGTGDATAPIVTIPDGDILVAAGLVVTQDFDDTGTGPFNMYDVTQNDLWTDAGIGPTVAPPTNNRIGIASLDTTLAWGGKAFGPVMTVGPYPLVVYASVWNGDGAQGSLTALVCSYTPEAA